MRSGLGSGLAARRSRAPRGRRLTGRRGGTDRKPGGDAAPVLEATEGILDPVALAVEDGVVGDGHLAVGLGGEAGGDALVGERPAEPVGIGAAVGRERPGLGQRGQHRPGTRVVAGLAGRQDPADRAAMRVGGPRASATTCRLEVNPPAGHAR